MSLSSLLLASVPLHTAVWDDNLPLLDALLGSTPAPDLERMDGHGNTALLLAYRLGRTKAARMLLAAGAAPKARTRDGFEAIHCAALTGEKRTLQCALPGSAAALRLLPAALLHPHPELSATHGAGNPDLVRESVLAYLRETDAAFERRLPQLAASLAKAPDFELRMHWAFSSWIPLVTRMLPSGGCARGWVEGEGTMARWHLPLHSRVASTCAPARTPCLRIQRELVSPLFIPLPIPFPACTDTFTIYKRGTSLRLDSTLLAMNGLTWERGALSLVVWGEDMPRPGASFVLDHDMKTACDARLAFTSPEDVSQQDWVRKLLTKPFKVTDYWSRDARIVPKLTSGSGMLGGLAGLLGGLGLGSAPPPEPRGRLSEKSGETSESAGDSSPAPISVTLDAEEPPLLARADVGVWEACGCYELRNLCVRDVTHVAVMPEAALPLKSWWKAEYSRQVAAGVGADAASAGYSSQGGGQQDSGGGGGDGGGAACDDDVPEARLALLHRALRAIREGRIDELAGARDASALEGMWAGEAPGGASRKLGHAISSTSFEDYFGAQRPESGIEEEKTGSGEAPASLGVAPYVHTDGKLHRPQAMLAEFKHASITTEDKVLDLKMAFAKDFPLTKEQFLPIAEVMARTARHAANFRAFFDRAMPRGAGFPVQLSLPVFPTVTATVTFEYCSTHRAPPRDMFAMPEDYKMGAYVERGWVRQL